MSSDSTEHGKTDQESREVEEYSPADREDDFIGTDSISRVYSQSNADDVEKAAEAGDPVRAGALAEAKNQGKEGPKLERSGSMKSGSSTHGFFSSKVSKERKNLVMAFLKNWAIISVCLLVVFSIYWGAQYKRSSHYHRIKMLVVIEDEQVQGVEPLVGNLVREIAESPELKHAGNYIVYDSTEFEQHHHSVRHPDGFFNSTEEIHKLIHHQLYWVAVHVKPNTTYNLFQALKTANTSFDPNTQKQHTVDAIYETGRDLVNTNSTILSAFSSFQRRFSPETLSRKVYPQLLSNLTSSQKSNLINNAPSLLTNVPVIQLVDNLPVTDSVLLAPSQVGMIFLIIITFFQFNFFAPVHQLIAKSVHKSHFAIYRMLSAQISYFVLSLAYSWVSLAFQVDFSKAFGHSGFLVYWMTCFLTMSAVGGVNENMALFIIPMFPPVLGFWLLFWVISNISPTFSPIAVLSVFYRYGYAFPLHNAGEIFKVIFTNSYKGQLGRNYGILIAWIVVNNILFPFLLKRFGKIMGKKAAAAAAAAAAQKK